MSTEVIINNVYLNCGWVEHRYRLPKAKDWWSDARTGSVLSPEGGILIVRWWEPFVTVELEGETPESQGKPRGEQGTKKIVPITSAADLGALIYKRFGRRANFQQAACFAGAEILPETSLECRFMINTSSEQFRRAAASSEHGNGGGMCIEIEFILVQKRTAGVEQQRTSLHLRLEPVVYPPCYQGVLAVDFGNTETNLASLDAGRPPSTRFISLLPDLQFDREALNLGAHLRGESPVDSLLRIDAVTDCEEPTIKERFSPQELLSQPEAYYYRIGRHTNVGMEEPHGLVANPKRAVVAPRGKVKYTILTRVDEEYPARQVFDRRPDYQLELPGPRPAELFLCRLLEGFRGLHRAWPRRLAMTYPSTYSAGELARFRETVAQAWRLAERFNPQRNFLQQEEVIALVIDEASAAAFYYLSRWVLEGPGGLRSFRWYYPEGFYLLVYDCGGATTDVSLVKAEAPQHDLLRLTVLGRSGLRDFGGDDITVAVFLLLKARLAEKLAERSRERVPRVPNLSATGRGGVDPVTFREFFRNEENLEAWDQLVPTDYHKGASGGSLLARQRLRMLMWQWAEEVKKCVSTGQDPTKGMPAIWARIRESLGDFPRELFDQIRVSPQEINALIEDQVKKSVRLCRNLLESKLAFRLGKPDDVFLVGNGSRYPLVGQTLRQEFLGEPLGEKGAASGMWRFCPSLMGLESSFSEADLKDCVAKGAAMALALRQGSLGLSLEFDTDLCRRLPFSIGWHDAAANTYVPLYHEGERYEELAPKTLNVNVREGSNPPTWIRLSHRWPGGEYEPFLIFEFDEGVEGPVTISFDAETEQFIATVDQTGQQVTGERDIDVDVYRAALQREKIRLSFRSDIRENT
ncbi:MAG: hypothetical protein RMJ16_10045 [Thermoguttaceae bacterium]|nr:hypothetical protein [Thermoguttaceae bacterium]